MKLDDFLFFGLRHLSDFGRGPFLGDGRSHRAYVVPALAFSPLQKVPERINEDVVRSRSLALLATADLANPPYRGSVFGCEGDGSSLSIVRNVLFTRAHGLELFLPAYLHFRITTL